MRPSFSLVLTCSVTVQITNDLEYLIEKAVGPNANADYAVVTGVQIHNWAADLEGDAPSMEFVAPSKVYAVVNGTKVHLDLGKVPVRSLYGIDSCLCLSLCLSSTLLTVPLT